MAVVAPAASEGNAQPRSAGPPLPAPAAPHRFIESRWPWLAASLALTLGLFVSTAVGWFWYADQREAQAHRSSLDLLWLEQAVLRALELNQKILVNWAHDLAPPAAGASEEFVSRIAGLMKENQALIAIDYLDAGGKRVTGWPQYVERPGQLPPVNDPLIAAAITRSRTLGLPEYSRVIEQGAPLWVLVVPIADEGRDHGSVLATYDLDRLLEQEVPWWFVQRYDLSLVDRNNKRLSPRDGALPDASADVHKLTFGRDDSGLSLWASPHVHSQPQVLLAWLSIAVVLFALLIMWLLRILQRWLRERQAAQRALSDSREQLYTVLAGLETAVSVTALDDGRMLFRNRQHLDVFALDPQGECCLLQAASAPLDMQPGSVEYADAVNGRWYHLERRTMRWVDGSTVLLDIATDITAERQAAHTARERDELLQHTARLASLAEFASGIAHELNQPLAAIANYSAVADSFLACQPPQMQKVEDAVARMGEEAHRAGQIIQSLRSFIQKRAVEHHSHRVLDLLTEPLALLEPLAQRLQLRVLVHAPAVDAVQIDCDGVMIEQVLFNLLRNAMESVASFGAPAAADAVTVRIDEDGDGVTICVEDRGGGIADPGKLFRPFYTTKSEGMGLGLAICRTVVESHGGRLWAEGRPGGGARLSFRLQRSTLVGLNGS